MPIMSLKQQATASSPSSQHFPMQSVTGEKQEALYMPVSNRSVYAGNGNPMAIVQPRILQNNSMQQQQYTSPINSEVKDAILSRLRHQIEQKEEFLKRPNKPLLLEPTPQQQQQMSREQMQFQRATYNFPQPNRLKADWLPQNVDQARSLESMRQHQLQQQQSASQELSDIQSNRLAIREQFFKDRSSTSNAYFSLPTSPYYAQESQNQQQQSNGSFIGSNSSMTEGSMSIKSGDDNRHHLRVIGSSPIPSQGLHIVSERTKQFESGRPLSPDGIDRTALYKSELSR
jgi:hypothetical protein